ncbi:MAG: hypothetical protein L0H53_05695 [Candidatus Nitrosocosmicus sp.]|nr:hypothetical protein [Candidatus Nitrosocosmicus sp.]
MRQAAGIFICIPSINTMMHVKGVLIREIVTSLGLNYQDLSHDDEKAIHLKMKEALVREGHVKLSGPSQNVDDYDFKVNLVQRPKGSERF